MFCTLLSPCPYVCLSVCLFVRLSHLPGSGIPPMQRQPPRVSHMFLPREKLSPYTVKFVVAAGVSRSVHKRTTLVKNDA